MFNASYMYGLAVYRKVVRLSPYNSQKVTLPLPARAEPHTHEMYHTTIRDFDGNDCMSVCTSTVGILFM